LPTILLPELFSLRIAYYFQSKAHNGIGMDKKLEDHVWRHSVCIYPTPVSSHSTTKNRKTRDSTVELCSIFEINRIESPKPVSNLK
jgi:hypothetical protein